MIWWQKQIDWNFMRNFLLYSFLLLLTACSGNPTIESNVTRFHDAALVTQGKSFLFQPSSTQVKSLEYKRYVAIVADELNALGMKEVSAPPADFGVTFTFSAGEGVATIETERRPYHLDAGYGWGGYGHGLGWGFGGPLYPSATLTRTTLFPREFQLQLQDLKAVGKPIRFEGKVLNYGTKPNFLPISRCIIHSLFTGFPGEDGESITVALPADSCIN